MMISKSDLVILGGASALLLVAVLRLGGPTEPTRTSTHYAANPGNASATHQGTSVMGQSTAPTTTAANVVITAATNSGKQVGTPVVVPQTVPAEPASDDFQQPDIIREAAFKTHVVKQGEYLGLIARRYNTTVSDLKKLNKMTDTTILVGQKLVYPTD